MALVPLPNTKHISPTARLWKEFDAYRMPRLTDTPVIEAHIMDNNEKAGGVGEPGFLLYAGTVQCHFDLTGKRIRRLPFDLNEV